MPQVSLLGDGSVQTVFGHDIIGRGMSLKKHFHSAHAYSSWHLPSEPRQGIFTQRRGALQMTVYLRTVVLSFVAMCALAPWSLAQAPVSSTAAANVWNALSAPSMDTAKSAHTENVEIVRDQVHINLTDGTIQFTQPVSGVVFGAVFHGKGRLQVLPPNPLEAQQLHLFTKQDKLNVEFTDATFSFTDGLLDEVAKQVKWQASASAADDTYAKRQKDREDLGESSMPRMLQGILSADHARTAYFLADLKVEKGWVEIRDDAMDSEDIRIGRWVDVGPFKIFDTWMSFPAGGHTSAEAWKDPQAKEDFIIRGYKIDAAVTSGADLNATTRLELEPRLAGQSVLIFDLDSNLRLESVKDSSNNALPFYQSRETKDRNQSYGDYVAVILPQPLGVGTPASLVFRYGGKRAIRKEGGGNYFCESTGWYPERPNSFSARSDFDITFHSPKNSILVATGGKTGETVEGGTRVTTWKSEIPLSVAGFAYGDYKVVNDKAGDVAVDIYANREGDDITNSLQRAFESGQLACAVGSMSPSVMGKTMGTEMANTVRVFSSYFGPYPYKHLSITSLPISYSYGQGWPGLIYLWSGSFLDSTQRNCIGLKDETALTDFFRGHESSHQWWGHRVGWKSYHDQWLSEGFADFSGILYVQYRESMKTALGEWRKEKEKIRNKDAYGHARGALGPIWMGQRIHSSVTEPGAYQDLIYSKGAYILQMLRMQLMNSREQDPDRAFKEMMQDYCKTFDNKAASTEDFKAIVEKHMSHGMDLDGNHKMDWFFNQYVYGTGEAQYTFHSAAEATDGKTHIKGEITRAGVPDNWKDAVPLYAHIGDKTVKMGLISVTHATEPFDFLIPGKIDRVSINDNEDLLAEVKQ
jgi:Peptidase family M1 domain